MNIFIYLVLLILLYCIYLEGYNNKSGLINFEVKTSSSEIFLKNELGVVCSNFFGCCKHGVMWGVSTPCWVL